MLISSMLLNYQASINSSWPYLNVDLVGLPKDTHYVELLKTSSVVAVSRCFPTNAIFSDKG